MDDPIRQLNELFGVVQDDLPVSSQSTYAKRVGKDADESRGFAAQCLEDGDYPSAIKHLIRAKDQLPQNDESIEIDLAGIYDVTDREDLAREHLENAVRKDKHSAEAHLGLASILSRNSNQREAINEHFLAIESNPKNPFLHYKLAELYRRIGFPKLATEAAKVATELSPEQDFYAFWLADLLLEQRRFSEALPHFRTAIEHSPGDDHYYLRAAMAFWGNKQAAEAQKALLLAKELNTENELAKLLHPIIAEYPFPTKDAFAKIAKASPLAKEELKKLERMLV